MSKAYNLRQQKKKLAVAREFFPVYLIELEHKLVEASMRTRDAQEESHETSMKCFHLQVEIKRLKGTVECLEELVSRLRDLEVN